MPPDNVGLNYPGCDWCAAISSHRRGNNDARWFVVYGNLAFPEVTSEVRLCDNHAQDLHDNPKEFQADELVMQNIHLEKLCYNCHTRYSIKGPWCVECWRSIKELTEKLRSP